MSPRYIPRHRSPGRQHRLHDSRNFAPVRTQCPLSFVPLHNIIPIIRVSAIFTRLIPLAKEHNVRLILLNRRGYPGSTPYTDEELAGFPAALGKGATEEDVEHAKEKLGLWMKARTQELLRFLEYLVRIDGIRPVQRKTNVGGIVVVGWSFAALMVLALVSYGPTFSASNVDLGRYLRRVVMHGERRLSP